MKNFIILLINIYQYFSKLTPSRCRFYPTCSQYTKEAILKYGLIKGGVIGIKRICRCHPLNKGGYDPVPWIEDCMKNIALILASGTGSRCELNLPKQFAKIGNKTILEYTLDVFETHKLIDEIYLE